jgi:RNA polymerase sigma-70 factor, ECF subfamily
MKTGSPWIDAHSDLTTLIDGAYPPNDTSTLSVREREAPRPTEAGLLGGSVVWGSTPSPIQPIPPVMGKPSAPRLLPVPHRRSANISDVSSDGRAEALDDVRTFDPVRRLVDRARDGDKDAYGQIFRLHHDAIFRYARLHIGAEAEDIVAEVFTRAWIQLPGYEYTDVPFVAWLYGIARYVVADEVRRQARFDYRPTVPETLEKWAEDDRLELAEAITKLPDEQRQVIELKFLMGMRNLEVADATEMTSNAVNAKQWRALTTLREELGEGA